MDDHIVNNSLCSATWVDNYLTQELRLLVPIKIYVLNVVRRPERLAVSVWLNDFDERRYEWDNPPETLTYRQLIDWVTACVLFSGECIDADQ